MSLTLEQCRNKTGVKIMVHNGVVIFLRRSTMLIDDLDACRKNRSKLSANRSKLPLLSTAKEVSGSIGLIGKSV